MSASADRCLLIHWPRFGPYHRARLKATVGYFGERGVRASGLEIASSDSTYAWREEPARDQPIHTLFPGQPYEVIPFISLWRSMDAYLKQVQPAAVAINGYSSKSARLLLLWCKIHRCQAILMSDTKEDDYPRRQFRESLKGLLVRQYDAYLCGGALHREYLEKLGASRQRIFLGYDVVDNEFYQRKGMRAKQNSKWVNALAGLADPRPFFLASSRFIPRKNLMGLLQAYSIYIQMIKQAGESAWRLIILGAGPQLSELEMYIQEENLCSLVVLPGFRQIEELPAYYASATVFIHAALQEQWGLVVNEAMASGLPVIVSERCGCVPELVRDGVNGFTFDPLDSRQLAELMFGCSSGRFQLGTAGESSRRMIERWGVNRFAASLYDALSTTDTVLGDR